MFFRYILCLSASVCVLLWILVYYNYLGVFFLHHRLAAREEFFVLVAHKKGKGRECGEEDYTIWRTCNYAQTHGQDHVQQRVACGWRSIQLGSPTILTTFPTYDRAQHHSWSTWRAKTPMWVVRARQIRHFGYNTNALTESYDIEWQLNNIKVLPNEGVMYQTQPKKGGKNAENSKQTTIGPTMYHKSMH